MKQSSAAILALLIIIIAGFGVFALQVRQPSIPVVTNESTSADVESDVSLTDDSERDDVDQLSQSANSKYVEYDEGVLDETKGTRRVLFFFANWCPTCIPVDKKLTEQTARIPQDVIVIRVNYNDTQTDQAEEDLADQYNVTYQHTFVQIDAQGNEVTKWNGGGIDELLQNIN